MILLYLTNATAHSFLFEYDDANKYIRWWSLFKEPELRNVRTIVLVCDISTNIGTKCFMIMHESGFCLFVFVCGIDLTFGVLLL